jgi:hypothetical protein
MRSRKSTPPQDPADDILMSPGADRILTDRERKLVMITLVKAFDAMLSDYSPEMQSAILGDATKLFLLGVRAGSSKEDAERYAVQMLANLDEAYDAAMGWVAPVDRISD